MSLGGTLGGMQKLASDLSTRRSEAIACGGPTLQNGKDESRDGKSQVMANMAKNDIIYVQLNNVLDCPGITNSERPLFSG